MTWDEDTTWGPVDPWAGSTAGLEEPTINLHPDPPTRVEVIPQTVAAAHREMRRPLYGAVYCLQAAADPDKYVGKAGPRKGRDGRKSPCSPGRRVDEHRREKDWGPEILPGRRGYRVLEWVEESGFGPEYDEANLAYREAWWIQRVRPTENIHRPAPIRPDVALAARRARPVATHAASRRPPARRPVARLRVFGFVFWLAVYGLGAAWALSHADAPWVPWVWTPPIALALAWSTLWEIRRKYDQLTRPAARPTPKRRRRHRRSR